MDPIDRLIAILNEVDKSRRFVYANGQHYWHIGGSVIVIIPRMGNIIYRWFRPKADKLEMIWNPKPWCPEAEQFSAWLIEECRKSDFDGTLLVSAPRSEFEKGEVRIELIPPSFSYELSPLSEEEGA